MRRDNIDVLRFIGLAMIVLAHVDPPSLIRQLRSFDVPLMVLVSGMSFGLSYKAESYAAYVWKRVKRLLFPTWIFLTAYFLLMHTTGHPVQLPDTKTIITSYLLLSGIGYVWIIRVFLLVAIAAPSILRLSRCAGSHTQYFSILSASYIGYELLRYATRPYLSSAEESVFDSTVLYIIPYSILFAVGLRLPNMSRNQVLRLIIMSFVIFGTIGIAIYVASGQYILTGEFKHPPTIYYLSYALGVSCVAWLASDAISSKIKEIGVSAPVLFLAQNSMWIYLWHIPLITIFPFPFYVKYPCVLALASLMVFIQVSFVRHILLPNISNASTKKNLSLLFTG